jgi:hypothetical protein
VRFLLAVTLLSLLASANLAAQSARPISYQGLRDALKSGMEPAELVSMIKRHGVEFEMSNARESELKSEGATGEVLIAIRNNYRGVHEGGGGSISSIRDVHKLYIEKMSHDLDAYIKSEIARQMPNRVVVVLQREGADAIMSGSATDTNGTVTVTDARGKLQLWTSAAGDRNPVLIVHEGQKKIAQRLVSNLKSSMD